MGVLPKGSPTEPNPRHYRGAATTAARAGNHVVAAELLNTVLEHTLRLEPGTWYRALKAAAVSRSEDLVWMTDESVDAPALIKVQIFVALLVDCKPSPYPAPPSLAASLSILH